MYGIKRFVVFRAEENIRKAFKRWSDGATEKKKKWPARLEQQREQLEFVFKQDF